MAILAGDSCPASGSSADGAHHFFMPYYLFLFFLNPLLIKISPSNCVPGIRYCMVRSYTTANVGIDYMIGV
jgi:hypothetical protein